MQVTSATASWQRPEVADKMMKNPHSLKDQSIV